MILKPYIVDVYAVYIVSVVSRSLPPPPILWKPWRATLKTGVQRMCSNDSDRVHYQIHALYELCFFHSAGLWNCVLKSDNGIYISYWQTPNQNVFALCDRHINWKIHVIFFESVVRNISFVFSAVWVNSRTRITESLHFKQILEDHSDSGVHSVCIHFLSYCRLREIVLPFTRSEERWNNKRMEE